MKPKFSRTQVVTTKVTRTVIVTRSELIEMVKRCTGYAVQEDAAAVAMTSYTGSPIYLDDQSEVIEIEWSTTSTESTTSSIDAEEYKS